jgi:phosphonate transport system substrate-binding protein
MKRSSIIKCLIYFLPLCIMLSACMNKNSETNNTYQPVFSADTSGNQTLVWGFPSFSYCEHAELVVKYLNKNLSGAHIIVKAFSNWEEYVSYLNQNKFDITLVNGMVALAATNKGYSIFGKIMDDSQFVSVIFTRKDADIEKVSDFKGKTISLTPSRMIPGTMMPLYYLYQHGLTVNSEMKKVNVASFESAIISTYLGKSEAGVCMKRNWEVYIRDHPEVLSIVELKWETPPLVNNALLIKKTTDEKITAQLRSLFFSMHTTTEGKAALNRLDISGFEKATRDNYKPMLDFIRSYDSVIH